MNTDILDYLKPSTLTAVLADLLGHDYNDTIVYVRAIIGALVAMVGYDDAIAYLRAYGIDPADVPVLF